MTEEQGPRYTAPVTEIRVSPDGHRMARRIPFAFQGGKHDKTWVGIYFVEEVGLTMEVFEEDQVADWRVVMDEG